ncbi:MAG: hypothetical protein J6U56_07065 [Spirochaetia bacterium]|nr:hypothetical protein [Spirochaetia bacterium]
MEGHQVRIFPTDNHMMYLYKGDKVEAGKLKVGDLLQGFQKDGFQPMEVVYIERGQKLEGFNTIDEVFDITVEDTHNYTLTGGVNVSNSKRLGSL